MLHHSLAAPLEVQGRRTDFLWVEQVLLESLHHLRLDLPLLVYLLNVVGLRLLYHASSDDGAGLSVLLVSPSSLNFLNSRRCRIAWAESSERQMARILIRVMLGSDLRPSQVVGGPGSDDSKATFLEFFAPFGIVGSGGVEAARLVIIAHAAIIAQPGHSWSTLNSIGPLRRVKTLRAQLRRPVCCSVALLRLDRLLLRFESPSPFGLVVARVVRVFCRVQEVTGVLTLVGGSRHGSPLRLKQVLLSQSPNRRVAALLLLL